MELQRAMDLINAVRENVSRNIVGKDEVIDKILACMACNGHILLEDVPGTGKTLLAKSLAQSIGGQYRRIQFTPDLMPGDVTGVNVYNQRDMAFEFKPGPVFAEVLLADEINRATPRSQAALLECMEERHVTLDGVTHPLPKPFLVIATQNPVETAGTFPLPEAQLDRFIMRLSMGYPSADETVDIIRRYADPTPPQPLSPVVQAEDVAGIIEAGAGVHISDAVLRYIAVIAEASRVVESVALGFSPRGVLAMVRALRGYALTKGRDYVLPDDVKALAHSVFAHRIITRNLYGLSSGANEVLDKLLHECPVPTEV